MDAKDLVWEICKLKFNHEREFDTWGNRRLEPRPHTADWEIERAMDAAGALLPLGHHQDARYREDIEAGLAEGYEQRREKYMLAIAQLVRDWSFMRTLTEEAKESYRELG